jgi:hypothetical protein
MIVTSPRGPHKSTPLGQQACTMCESWLSQDDHWSIDNWPHKVLQCALWIVHNEKHFAFKAQALVVNKEWSQWNYTTNWQYTITWNSPVQWKEWTSMSRALGSLTHSQGMMLETMFFMVSWKAFFDNKYVTIWQNQQVTMLPIDNTHWVIRVWGGKFRFSWWQYVTHPKL